MVNKVRRRLGILLLCALVMLCMVPSIPVYARWTDQADQSIYTDAGAAGEDNRMDGLEKDGHTYAQDVLDELFGRLCLSAGDQLYNLTAPSGFEMNSIIYGRVGGNAEVSLFQMDLSNGNFYGIMAMAVYGYIRNFMILIMFIVFMYQLVGYLYTRGSSRSRDRLMGNIQTYAIMTLALIMLPFFLDILFYLKDNILYGVMEYSDVLVKRVSDVYGYSLETTNSPGMFFRNSSSVGLIERFRSLAMGVDAEGVENIHVVTGAMYLGSVVLQIYLGICYIASAYSLVVLVILFPLIACMEMFYRGGMENWWKQVIGIVLNPILDSILLILPMLIMIIGLKNDSMGYYAMAMIACACMIPARGVIRQLLGVGRGLGFEMAGIGAAIGAATLVRSAGRGAFNLARTASDGIRSYKNDMDTAEALDIQAKRMDEGSKEAVDSIANSTGAMLGGDFDGNKGNSGIRLEGLPEGDAAEEMSPQERAAARIQSLSSAKDGLNRDIKDNELEISKLEQSKAVDSRLRDERRSENDLIKEQLHRIPKEAPEPTSPEYAEYKRHKEENAPLLAKMRDNDKQIAMFDRGISDANRRIGALKKTNSEKKMQLNTVNSALSGLSGGGAGRAGTAVSAMAPGMPSPELDRLANIHNMDLPEMRGISLERRAELYRERARSNAVLTAGRVAGSAVGMTYGGVIGASAATFFSPGTKAIMAGAGMDLGASLGELGGTMSGAGINYAAGRVRNIRNISVQPPAIPTAPVPSNPAPIDPDLQNRQIKEQAMRDYMDRQMREQSQYPGMDSGDSRGNDFERRSLYDAAASVREMIAAQKKGTPGFNKLTPDEKETWNDELLDQCVQKYESSMRKGIYYNGNEDELGFSQDDFENYMNERFGSEDTRNALKSFLKGQGLLF